MSEPHPTPPLRHELEFRMTSPARWSAVIAGVFVTTSLWLVLHLLGVGVGLTAINPDDGGSLTQIGVGVGVWSLIAPIIALFVGGLVASRLAPTPNRANRITHGALVWAVTSVVALGIIHSITMGVAKGVASAGSKVAGAAGELAARLGNAVDLETFKGLGVDADDLLLPINARLKADGKPAVTASSLESAAKDALETAASTGTLDRATLVKSLTRNTALTARDVDDLAGAVETRWNAVSKRVSEVADHAKHAALKAAEMTGKAVMSLAIAMLCGLLAALGGALLTGQRDRRHTDARDDRRPIYTVPTL